MDGCCCDRSGGCRGCLPWLNGHFFSDFCNDDRFGRFCFFDLLASGGGSSVDDGGGFWGRLRW